MKYLTYRFEDKIKVGVLSKDKTKVYPTQYNDIIDLIKDNPNDFGADLLLEEPIKLSLVEQCAPIPTPIQDVICLGVNYKDHAQEVVKDSTLNIKKCDKAPVYFSKRVNFAVPNGGIIPSHSNIVDNLDYEVELAVIIGKDAKNILIEDAFDYVFGYSIVNDISARNLQSKHSQWYFGKSLDGFFPMGPWIVTKDEFKNPPSLNLSTRVNNELRQSSNTNMLIYGIDYVISQLSQGITLKASTIIAMGTPAGVGFSFDPPKFLTSGDIVTCEIEGIGILENTIE